MIYGHQKMYQGMVIMIDIRMPGTNGFQLCSLVFRDHYKTFDLEYD
jgi:YesN/AraC family two-component response regulator